MQSRSVIRIALCFLSAVCLAGQELVRPLPEISASVQLDGMPSFHQRNVEFAEGGKKFCGPTAASNALMWLADNGYPNLKPVAGDEPRVQTEMIKRLAGFMGTYREGTSVSCFTSGIKVYLESAGYSCKSWVYSGDSSANRSQSPPDLGLVNALSDGKTVMWFSVGWYSYDASCKKYTRSHGHWLTLVGFGKNRDGAYDPDCYAVADPEFPNAFRYVTLKRLEDGRLTNGKTKLDAKGYFNVVELDQRREGTVDKYCILETIEAMTVE